MDVKLGRTEWFIRDDMGSNSHLKDIKYKRNDSFDPATVIKYENSGINEMWLLLLESLTTSRSRDCWIVGSVAHLFFADR